MTIEHMNTRLTCKCEVSLSPDYTVRGGLHHNVVARIKEFCDEYGYATPYKMKRQLARTRHLCRTVIDGVEVPRTGKISIS